MNTTRTLLTCGCSFTEQNGWANQVKRHFGYSTIKNLAVGGGSNTTQIHRFNDFVLHGHQPFDLIWQITYPSRVSNLRLPPDHPDIVTKKFKPAIDRGFTYAQTSPLPNVVDGRRHVDVLYNEYANKVKSLKYCDVNNDIASLLATILLAKHLADNLLVFFGADDIEASQVDAIQKFLSQQRISYVDHKENLLSWVKTNGLEMAEDGFHPSQTSYQQYADAILIPKIQSTWKI